MAPAFPNTTKLPSPIIELIQSAQLIKQGAEAKVYKTVLYPSPSLYPAPIPSTSTLPSLNKPTSKPILLKHRFPKTYRHPTLDALLTKQRLTWEARALVRCMKAGVKVPGLRIVDVKEGVIGMEWIEGWSVREVLGGGQDGEGDDEEGEEGEEEKEDILELLKEWGIQQDEVLLMIGEEIGKMHLADIIHGDLTTSNMMVRLLFDPTSPSTTPSTSLPEVLSITSTNPKPKFEVVMIDFGLTSTSILPEDRSVDLYVLERAFASTHPVPLLESGEEGIPLFEKVLEGYKSMLLKKGKKGDWGKVEVRLEEVRGRGRKRSMIG